MTNADLRANKPDQSPGAVSVLVVDDDPLLRSMTQVVLEGLGYRVLLAASGTEGMQALTREDGQVDLVILDQRMPDLDGITVLQRAHARWPDLRVLLVTGYATEEMFDALTAAGAVGLLEKPYDVDTLIRTVMQALGLSGDRR